LSKDTSVSFKTSHHVLCEKSSEEVILYQKTFTSLPQYKEEEKIVRFIFVAKSAFLGNFIL